MSFLFFGEWEGGEQRASPTSNVEWCGTCRETYDSQIQMKTNNFRILLSVTAKKCEHKNNVNTENWDMTETPRTITTCWVIKCLMTVIDSRASFSNQYIYNYIVTWIYNIYSQQRNLHYDDKNIFIPFPGMNFWPQTMPCCYESQGCVKWTRLDCCTW